MHPAKRHRSPPADRRHFSRFKGNGLMAMVNGALVEIQDISLSGARLEAGFAAHDNAQVTLKLIPRQGSKLALNESIQAEAVVVRHDAESISVHFTRVSYALARMIIRHTSDRLGIAPFLLK